MKPYRIYLRLEAVQALQALRRSEKGRMGQFIDSLAADPFKAGDYTELDETGRSIQVKVVGRFALAYWSDHAVQEIRIVEVLEADGQR